MKPKVNNQKRNLLTRRNNPIKNGPEVLNAEAEIELGVDPHDWDRMGSLINNLRQNPALSGQLFNYKKK